MAKYPIGLLGGISGTVGPVVGTSRYGKPYLKSRQRKSHKPRSLAQLQQQARFSLLQGFLLSIRHILMRGFKDNAQHRSGINSAYAYNYPQAILGTYPSFTLDFKAVLVSRGPLLNAADAVAEAYGNGMVRMRWRYDPDKPMSHEDDRCMVVLYCPEQKQAICITDGNKRSTGMQEINAGIFNGKELETWLAFITASGETVATSIYTGQVRV